MTAWKKLGAAALACLVTLIATPAAAAPVEVVASFSIMGDLARQVGGERVKVTTLVGHDADAHSYQPRPSDARLLSGVNLVVMNGLGFDAWTERVARSAGYKGTVLVASTGIKPLAEKSGHDHGHGHSHGGAIDPHAWQDVSNVQRYVANIAEALAAVDPAGAAEYRANAARYGAELAELDRDIRNALSQVPQAQRRIVTSHDAFAYFAKAYGVRFLAAAGVSNQSEASAAGVAQLVRQLRREKVPAVFVENVADPRLVEAIRKETGARLGAKLYSDALSGPDGPAPTYLALMRHNLGAIMEALAPVAR